MNDNHNEGIGVLQDTVRHEFYMEILCVCVCVYVCSCVSSIK